jgi:hypothetical protein
VYCPTATRNDAWQTLADEFARRGLPGLTQDVTLDQVIGMGEDIVGGRVRGRTVVKL